MLFRLDRKSTRLNSSHGYISYAVFCLKKKNQRAPEASFPLTLRVGIIPKHIYAGMAPAQIASSPYSGSRAFGTGPFKVGSINQPAIPLARNPNAVPQPYLDHLVLRTYPATDPQLAIRAVLWGAADLVGGIQPQEVDTLLGRTGLTVLEARMFTNSFVSLTPDGDGKFCFSDPTVRRALVQAVDRQKIVSEVLAGRADADPNPIPTAGWAYSAAAAALHPYDAIAAAKNLESAGWVVDAATKIRAKKGAPVKVTMVAADSYPNQQIAEAIARQLLAIGIQGDVKPFSASKLLQDYLLAHK